uniref:Uncharacterized protein n=1 Tax=Timema bartmani TaxID=61472 RepID=A0A7R9FBX7_9NEOP|nr:unnamed protein product [Timema bartmani]
MEEDDDFYDDVFEDTISLRSNPQRGNRYISLSQVTIYHSAEDFHLSDDKMATAEDASLVEKYQEDSYSRNDFRKVG